MVAILAIRECNIEKIEKVMEENPNAIFYRVCRTYIFLKEMRDAFVLVPSMDLYRDYHHGKITWQEYVPGYLQQIQGDQEALEKLQEIKKEAESNDVYFVCVCGRGEKCHRFLLIDIIFPVNQELHEHKEAIH